jgi:uncharacterized iron-regulated protein
MRHLLLFSLFLTLTPGFAQDLPAYQIFTSNGKKTTFKALTDASVKRDVVLFGELHDNPISHWLQLELAKALYIKSDSNLCIGAEMFELHQANALNRFLQNGDLKQLKDSAKLWSNFDTDYAPLLVWAQENRVEYFATNVTRKYASTVFKKGLASLDTISESEKQLMCPLPFPFDSTLSQYRELIKMGLEMHASGIDFALAQALKDATMAYEICARLDAYQHFLHLNGAFHSDYFQGIMWYIQHYRPNATVLTITTVSQEDLKKLDKESIGKADFIIVTPATMTKTM